MVVLYPLHVLCCVWEAVQNREVLCRATILNTKSGWGASG